MQPHVSENLDEARTAISLRATMWRSLAEWNKMNETWIGEEFSRIDANAIAKEADKYYSIAMRIEKNLDPNPIQETLKSAVVKFKQAMPIVKALSNPKMTPKHRDEVKDLVKKDFDVSQPDFTLKSLLDLDIGEFQEEIVAISTQATQEAKLDDEINEIDAKWKEIDFVFTQDDDVIKVIALDEIFEALDETLSAINMILGSRFVKPL